MEPLDWSQQRWPQAPPLATLGERAGEWGEGRAHPGEVSHLLPVCECCSLSDELGDPGRGTEPAELFLNIFLSFFFPFWGHNCGLWKFPG